MFSKSSVSRDPPVMKDCATIDPGMLGTFVVVSGEWLPPPGYSRWRGSLLRACAAFHSQNRVLLGLVCHRSDSTFRIAIGGLGFRSSVLGLDRLGLLGYSAGRNHWKKVPSLLACCQTLIPANLPHHTRPLPRHRAEAITLSWVPVAAISSHRHPSEKVLGSPAKPSEKI